MNKQFLPFLFFVLLYHGITQAQLPDLPVQQYTMKDGLTQNNTGSLLKDSHGFLWIGTSWGLNRFDGRVMKAYNKIGPELLPDLHINSLAEDKNGDIWISTSIGLSRLNPYTETFTNYPEGTGPGKIPHSFCHVYADKEKNIWLADSYGISLFKKETNSFINYPVTTAGKDTRINRYISTFLEDSKGRFWLGTSYGIKLFDRATKTYHSYHFEDSDQHPAKIMNAAQGLFEDKDGNIWAGTWNAGLLKFNPVKNIFDHYLLTADPFAALNSVHDVNAITLNGHYYLLLATGAGLVLADPVKAVADKIPVEKIIESPDNNPVTPLKGKTAILKDNQGLYWITGADGLSKIDPGKLDFQWKYLPDPAFRQEAIFHIITDIKDPVNKVYLSTKNGWWQYDLSTNVFSRHTVPARYAELLNNINRFLPEENGYWFTSQLGVGFYNPETNTVKDISPLVNIRFDNMARTGHICKDKFGRIWFTVYRSGIRIYDPLSGKMTALFEDSTKPANLFSKTIFDMKAATDGSIVLTTGENVYQVNPETFSFTISTPEKSSLSSVERTGPRRILFAGNNRTLIMSQQRIYRLLNGKLVQVYPESGFTDFIMEDYVQVSENEYLVITNLGVFKTDPNFSQWIKVSDRFLTGNSETFSEIRKAGKERLIVCATGRICVFSLQSLSKNSSPPPVLISRFKTGTKEEYLVSVNTVNRNMLYKEAVEIELSALDFTNDPGHRIYYQLNGRDPGWVELTGNPVIRYDQLSPGNYQFKVKSTNGAAAWSPETLLNFSVLPPFWRTTWFFILCILVIAAILYVIYRYRIRQLLREERLRSMIATDLHDDIGATLSSISIYSETIKQQTLTHLPHLSPMLDKMGETSREMVGNMSDIVWAINPKNDSFEKMVGRMQNLAAELCAAKNIELHFTADEKLTGLQLNMVKRRNIYLIFKEALNNALKYASGKNLEIHLDREGPQLVLSVKDDGTGFNEAQVAEHKPGGNGLKNMRQRAREIGGNLVIESAQDKGTRVVLRTSIT